MKRLLHTHPTPTPLGILSIENGYVHLTISPEISEMLTEENIDEHYRILDTLCDPDSFYPFIIDVNDAKPVIIERRLREQLNAHFFKYASCASFYSTKSKVNFMINLYFKLARTKVPMRIFKSIEEANNWGDHMQLRTNFVFTL